MNLFQAKNLHIIDYLESLGTKPAKEYPGAIWFHSPFRKDDNPSFKVDLQKNIWYDFGSGEGGNIVELVKKLDNLCTREAVKKVELQSFSFDPNRFKVKGTPGHIKILCVRNLSHNALIVYIMDRSVNIKFAEIYLQECTYSLYQRQFFAIAFRNDQGGYELRNRKFKGSSSPKFFTTIPGKNHSRTINLFEGFMDFLSCCTYYDQSPDHDCIILNSLSFLPRALLVLKKYYCVNLYIDNDRAGLEAKKLIIKNCNKVVDHSGLIYPGHKDFNEFLIQKSKNHE